MSLKLPENSTRAEDAAWQAWTFLLNRRDRVFRLDWEEVLRIAESVRAKAIV